MDANDFKEKCAWCGKVYDEKEVKSLTLRVGNSVIVHESALCESCRKKLIDAMVKTENDIVYFRNDEV